MTTSCVLSKGVCILTGLCLEPKNKGLMVELQAPGPAADKIIEAGVPVWHGAAAQPVSIASQVCPTPALADDDSLVL